MLDNLFAYHRDRTDFVSFETIVFCFSFIFVQSLCVLHVEQYKGSLICWIKVKEKWFFVYFKLQEASKQKKNTSNRYGKHPKNSISMYNVCLIQSQILSVALENMEHDFFFFFILSSNWINTTEVTSFRPKKKIKKKSYLLMFICWINCTKSKWFPNQIPIFNWLKTS